MNDPRYRGPSRNPGRTLLSDYAKPQDEPGFEEEHAYRISRSSRSSGDDGERRSGRGPSDSGLPPRRRPSRPPESGEEFDPRPARKPRPSGLNPGMSPTRRPRDPEEMDQPGRPARRDERREPRKSPRSDPDWEAEPRQRSNPEWEGERPSRSGPDWSRERPSRSNPEWGRDPAAPPDLERRPRRRRPHPEWERDPSSRSGAEWGEPEPGRRQSSRKPGKKSKKKAPLDPRAKRQRLFRYLGLLGIMLFGGLGGLCINYGILIGAVPALLLAVGCAGTFVYF